MATTEEAIDYFKKYHKKGEHLCVLVWQVGDVLEQATEIGIKCSKEEAEIILEDMEQHHDASVGISWETINGYLNDLRFKHEEAEAEKKAEKKRKEKVVFS